MKHGVYVVVDTTKDIEKAAEFVGERLDKFGKVMVYAEDARSRSVRQNKLMHLMYRTIAKQLYGNDVDHAKHECKLTIGIKLLRDSDPQFKQFYDRNLRDWPHEKKLQAMEYLPVTRLFSVGVAYQYIESIYDSYADKVTWNTQITTEKESLGKEPG